MESMVWPAILFAILMLLLLAAVLFLAVLHTKTNTEVTRFLTQQQERNDQRTQEQNELLRDTMQEILDASSSSVSASLAATTGLLRETMKEVTFGSSSSVSELTKLVRETTTLLASKDPIAYQMAVGAQAAQPGSGDWQPYTSTDAEANAEAEQRLQQKLAVEDLLSRMSAVATPGAASVDAYTFPEPE